MARAVWPFVFPLLACHPSPGLQPGGPASDDSDTPTTSETDSDGITDSDGLVDTDTSRDSDTALAEDTDVPPVCPAGVAAFVAGLGYPDLQSAFDASMDQDTIDICPGRWSTDVSVFYDGSLTVQSINGDESSVVLLPPVFNEASIDIKHLTGTARPTVIFQNLTIEGRVVIYGKQPWYETDGNVIISNITMPESGSFHISHFSTANISSVRATSGDKLNFEAISIQEVRDSIRLEDIYLTGVNYWAQIISIIRMRTVPDNLNIELRNLTISGNSTASVSPLLLILEGGSTTVEISDSTFTGHDAAVPYIDTPESGMIEIMGRFDRPADIDVQINNCLFDGNLGGIASHLTVLTNGRDYGGHTNVHIRDTAFYRGDYAPAFLPSGTENDGHAIRRRFDTVVHFDNVDFGTGPTSNLRDLTNCPDIEGIVASAVWESDATCP